MTQQLINIGAAANDGTGDPIRVAFDKSNQNFSDVYANYLPVAGGVLTGTLTTKGHSAFGNYGEVDTYTMSPGDTAGGNEYKYTASVTLALNEFHDFAATASVDNLFTDLAVHTGYRNTGTNAATLYPFVVDAAINSDSTGPLQNVFAASYGIANYGSGDITRVVGQSGFVNNFGAGHIATMLGCTWSVATMGGTTDKAVAVQVAAPYASGGTFTDLAGLEVADHSGIGSNTSYNIHSLGSASLNQLDGNLVANGHLAFGNHGAIDTLTYYPGDPVKGYVKTGQHVELVLNELFSGDLSDGTLSAALADLSGFKHTGTGTAYVQSFNLRPTINSDSTGPFGSFVGVVGGALNAGSGDISALVGARVRVTHLGSGNAGTMAGVQANAEAYAAATSLMGFHATANYVSGVVTNNYGILIDDQSAVGASTLNENLRSAGANSKNTFEGNLVANGHVAFGNHAAIDKITFYPGDSTGSNTQSHPGALPVIINDYQVGDLSADFSYHPGLTVNVGYKHTGTGSAYINAYNSIPSINGDSTGPFGSFSAMNATAYNKGSGDINYLASLTAGMQNGGTGTVANLTSANFSLGTFGGPVTQMSCVSLSAPYNGGPGVISDHAGLLIADQSAVGAVNSNHNILSQGASSVNVFEGRIRFGVASNPTPVSGDLWFDGTHLNFYNGTSVVQIA